MTSSAKTAMPPKRPTHEHRVLYVVVTLLVVLALGFCGTWLYLQHARQLDREVSYFRLPSLAVSRNGHSMSATFAVKTNGNDANWGGQNKRALEQVMTKVLMDADPQRVHAPGGLQKLQETLKTSINDALHTDKVQEVLITDFLVSEGDL
jgi:flagellar basal body-associated protein FliL